MTEPEGGPPSERPGRYTRSFAGMVGALLISLIVIIWLWAFPEPKRLPDAATLLLTVLALTLLAPVAPMAPAAPALAGTSTVAQAERKVPKLKVSTIVTNLDHPWDVRALPGGALIFTQRARATLSVFRHGKVHRVKFPSSSVWVAGETGLMGLEVDPNFTSNRRIYTCQGGFTGSGGHDVHVTCLLGAVSLLAASRDRWAGTVVAVFQPAEEVGDGARRMLHDGLTELVGAPDVALAQHVLPFPAGVVATPATTGSWTLLMR